MIIRHEYLEQLKNWQNEQVIKVITGIRRCGKSTLLKMFKDNLLSQGVTSEQIIFINFEDLAFDHLLDYKALYEYISIKLQPDKINYIFLDEIQKVSDFEKVVDSLYIKDNVDIYITGSNAYLLSGELATLISGRYVEINMLPLSFREFCSTKPNDAPEKLFYDYMQVGSFPYVANLDINKEKVEVYLEGIYNTIIVKDIEDRQKRRTINTESRKVTDILLLKNIARFLASSVGSPVSVKSITNYIISSGRKVSQNTINDYLQALVEPYIFYPVERYDISGKQLLKTNQKMYIVDLGIRNHLLPKKNYDLGFSLENIIFLELIRRGYRVNVGRIDNLEVDFIARKQDSIHYIQVTASLLDETTFNREMQPLKSIADNYKKTVLTLDRFTPGNYDGINVVNALDWLLGKA